MRSKNIDVLVKVGSECDVGLIQYTNMSNEFSKKMLLSCVYSQKIIMGKNKCVIILSSHFLKGIFL